MTRLALKHGTVLEKHENETFEQLIMLYGIPKAKVKCAAKKVNCVFKKSLTELKQIYVYCCSI